MCIWPAVGEVKILLGEWGWGACHLASRPWSLSAHGAAACDILSSTPCIHCSSCRKFNCDRKTKAHGSYVAGYSISALIRSYYCMLVAELSIEAGQLEKICCWRKSIFASQTKFTATLFPILVQGVSMTRLFSLQEEGPGKEARVVLVWQISELNL